MLMSKLNGHEVMAPSREDTRDVALLACASAFRSWSAEKQAAWTASAEFARVGFLCRSDPTDYGGEARLRSAIASCIADFDRTYEAMALRGCQLTEAEVAERQGSRAPPAPQASEGYGFRVCSKCHGAKEVRGQRCVCTLPLNGQPGYELFIIPKVVK